SACSPAVMDGTSSHRPELSASTATPPIYIALLMNWELSDWLNHRTCSGRGSCPGYAGLSLAHPSPLMQLTSFAACGVLGTRARERPAAPCHPRPPPNGAVSPVR